MEGNHKEMNIKEFDKIPEIRKLKTIGSVSSFGFSEISKIDFNRIVCDVPASFTALDNFQEHYYNGKHK